MDKRLSTSVIQTTLDLIITVIAYTYRIHCIGAAIISRLFKTFTSIKISELQV